MCGNARKVQLCTPYAMCSYAPLQFQMEVEFKKKNEFIILVSLRTPKSSNNIHHIHICIKGRFSELKSLINRFKKKKKKKSNTEIILKNADDIMNCKIRANALLLYSSVIPCLTVI